MIITLGKADFSDSNIGSSTTWRITKTLKGVTCSNSATTVNKGSTYSATFTVTSGYTFSSATVTMGGVDKTSSLVWNSGKTSATLSLATTETSGNIYVTITALSNSGSGDSGSGDEGESGSGTTTSWYIDSLDAVAATGKDLTGGTIFTGSSIAPVAFDNTFNAKLVGKTIDTIEFVPEKVGTITLGLYNTSTYAYTEKASITIAEADLNTRKAYTFTPFTVSDGELFTFYKSGDVGCMSYYLSKDVPGVDYCKGLQTKCNGAAPSAFNYDIVTLMNLGTSFGSGSSGEGGSSSTPTDTTWYINSLQQLQDSGNDIATNRVELAPSAAYHWAFNQFNSKLTGKTINTIELMPCKSGTFTVGIFDTSSNTVTDTRSFTVGAADINTVKTYTFENLTIPSDKYFVWNCSGKSNKDGEAAGYYVLKEKLDPLAVETSQWYQAKSTGLAAFSTYWLAFVANIGYTN